MPLDMNYLSCFKNSNLSILKLLNIDPNGEDYKNVENVAKHVYDKFVKEKMPLILLSESDKPDESEMQFWNEVVEELNNEKICRTCTQVQTHIQTQITMTMILMILEVEEDERDEIVRETLLDERAPWDWDESEIEFWDEVLFPTARI